EGPAAGFAARLVEGAERLVAPENPVSATRRRFAFAFRSARLERFAGRLVAASAVGLVAELAERLVATRFEIIARFEAARLAVAVAAACGACIGFGRPGALGRFLARRTGARFLCADRREAAGGARGVAALLAVEAARMDVRRGFTRRLLLLSGSERGHGRIGGLEGAFLVALLVARGAGFIAGRRRLAVLVRALLARGTVAEVT